MNSGNFLVRKGKRYGILLTALGLMLSAFTALGATTVAVNAAAPAPAAEFLADVCEGTTAYDDPKNSPGPIPDLTRVFGPRLAAYNEGRAVPLYDSYGGVVGAYPPLCAVYRDPETGEPVSNWMFCTDITKHACGDADAAGNLLEGDDIVAPLDDLTGNPDLSKEDERVIAYLIRNGHDYAGTAPYSWNNETRAGLETSEQRSALQTLIWCISDLTTDAGTGRGQTCADNMDAAEQARILALVPESPSIVLTMTSPGSELTIGQSEQITVKTNVLNQPIALTTSGTADVDLQVCAGPGTLSGGTLTVTGTDSVAGETVTLCAVAQSVGDFQLAAKATPATSEHLQWAQSDDPCQIFARFVDDAKHDVNAAMNLTVVAAVVPQTRPTLVTKASAQKAEVGARLFDTVTISGFVDGAGATGTATLYGPATKRSATMCTRANKVATVTFDPRNGDVRTPKVKVTKPGHYTWIASISEDTRNEAASHRCGLAVESTLVHKPKYTTPSVDTGFTGPATSLAARAAMQTVVYPGAKVNAPVVATGIRRGAMQIPASVAQLGWLKNSAAINDRIGATVIAGHVSDRRDRPGAMVALSKARKGQVVTVRTGTTTQRFKVVEVSTFSRPKTLPSRLFTTTGAHRLVLISCTGKVTKADGSWHYARNQVVVAKPIG